MIAITQIYTTPNRRFCNLFIRPCSVFSCNSWVNLISVIVFHIIRSFDIFFFKTKKPFIFYKKKMKGKSFHGTTSIYPKRDTLIQILVKNLISCSCNGEPPLSPMKIIQRTTPRPVQLSSANCLAPPDNSLYRFKNLLLLITVFQTYYI